MTWMIFVAGAILGPACLLGVALRRAVHRPPDFIVGLYSNPTMLRWHIVPRNRWCNLYLHCLLRDDEDRALHDHPWASLSLILRGGYREVLPGRSRVCRPGRLIFRPAAFAHRLELLSPGRHCWTLFLTGPRVRTWGFHCPQGWMPWDVFCDPSKPGEVGRGCPE